MGKGGGEESHCRIRRRSALQQVTQHKAIVDQNKAILTKATQVAMT